MEAKCSCSDCWEDDEAELDGHGNVDTCVKTPSSFSNTGFSLKVFSKAYGARVCLRETRGGTTSRDSRRGLANQERGTKGTYTKARAFLGFTHFLLMNIKTPMMAQMRQRLPTRQVIIKGGSRGTDTSSLQRSPW